MRRSFLFPIILLSLIEPLAQGASICPRVFRSPEEARALFGDAYVPMETLLREHSFNGFVFNGKTLSALSLDLKGSFKLTDRPSAGYGYFSFGLPLPAFEYSRNLGAPGGISIFKINADSRLTAVSGFWASSQPEAKGLPTNQAWKLVAEKHGIDVIIDFTGAAVFQHPQAFEAPKDEGEYLRWLEQVLVGLDPSYQEVRRGVLWQFFESYEQTYRYFIETNGTAPTASTPQQVREKIEQGFHARFAERMAARNFQAAAEALQGFLYMVPQCRFNAEEASFVRSRILNKLEGGPSSVSYKLWAEAAGEIAAQSP